MDADSMINLSELCSKKETPLSVRSKNESWLKLTPYSAKGGLSSESRERLSDVQELTDLRPLTNKHVLRCLQVRYSHDETYTKAGITLIAVNPFKSIPGLYEPSQVKKYHDKDCKKLPPHIFVTAENAYSYMNLGLGVKDQSIIVSGESGAGKTWTTRCLMKYLTSLVEYNPGGFSPSPVHCIEKRILDSNPILEAFGNATTQRNQNSSRFGKYIKLQFERSGYIVGASIQTYLLEKTRVVHQGPGEKNFHVFYQMLQSSTPDERVSWGFDNSGWTFNILPNTDIPTEEGSSLEATKNAMASVGINSEQQDKIFKILAAILHLGNIGFIQDEDDDACDIDDSVKVQDSLHMACSLLGLNVEVFTRYLLLRRIAARHKDRKSVFMKPCGETDSCNRRDCVAKLVYSRLFDWLVAFLNKHTVARNSNAFIGLLDIYGFESFQLNSLEQLCINYANEKLQQHFIGHFLRAEQEEYKKEGLQWNFCPFTDNQPCLDTIEGRMSVFSLLNEECKLNRPSNPSSLQDRLIFNTSSSFITSSDQRSSPQRAAFIIKHYADDVDYTVDGLVEKNKDYVPQELIELLVSSENQFIRTLIHEDLMAAKRPRSPTGKVPVKTVVSKFKHSLDDLMNTLTSTTPHYIRCIKPNPQCTPGVFESAFVANQLRACGVMATLNISRAGYPCKFPFDELLQRYRLIMSNLHLPSREYCRRLLERVCGLDNKENQCPGQISPYMIGKSKIFLQEKELQQLEGQRDHVLRAKVTILQRSWRRFKQRQEERRWREAAVIIQAAFRGWRLRCELQRMDDAARIIQHAMLVYCNRCEQERLEAALNQELEALDQREQFDYDLREVGSQSSVDVSTPTSQSRVVQCHTHLPITFPLRGGYSPSEQAVLFPSSIPDDDINGIQSTRATAGDSSHDINALDDSFSHEINDNDAGSVNELAGSDRENSADNSYHHLDINGYDADTDGVNIIDDHSGSERGDASISSQYSDSVDEGVAGSDSFDDSGDSSSSDAINVTQEEEDQSETSMVLANRMDSLKTKIAEIVFGALIVGLLLKGPIIL